jgi:hypothetical protein
MSANEPSPLTAEEERAYRLGSNPSRARVFATLDRERAHVAMLREQLQRAANELGVPQPGYPQPVANAAEIIAAALAATEADAAAIRSGEGGGT